MIFELKFQICSELDVDGLRGDIVTNRVKALAALKVDQKSLHKIFSSYPFMFKTSSS
jgi:hypothetical protein